MPPPLIDWPVATLVEVALLLIGLLLCQKPVLTFKEEINRLLD
jgi:hypothetical protein